MSIFFWKDYQGREVDFVIKEGLKVKQLAQVTYANTKDEIEKRETRDLIKAGEELRCRNLLVITWDYEGEEEIERKKNKIHSSMEVVNGSLNLVGAGFYDQADALQSCVSILPAFAGSSFGSLNREVNRNCALFIEFNHNFCLYNPFIRMKIYILLYSYHNHG